MKLHITNPTQLKREDTLDSAFFKKSHPVAFKAAIGIDAEGNAVVDADGKPVHPLYANTTFRDICFTFALKNGKGFHTWVYNIYIDIRACLSEEIYEKTSSVFVGDIVGLLGTVRLAILHHEAFNPDQLDIQFTTCTVKQHAL